MADVTDAGAALVTLIAAVAYPNGTVQPSVTGDPVKVYQGWPNAAALADDLKAGTLHVSVFPTKASKVTSVLMGEMDWEESGTTNSREVRRETRQFQITVWAPCFDKRDPLASAIDAALSATARLTLADGSTALLSYAGSVQHDEAQKAAIYRRDLLYAVNYATVQTQTLTPISHTTTNVTNGPMNASGPTITINT